MLPVIRSAAVLLVLVNVASVAVGGCGARVASEEGDRAAVAEAGTSGCDPTVAPSPGDASAGGDADADAGAAADAASEATGPKICNPQDMRTCEVATAAEGAACPMTFEQARATFTCASYPADSYYLVGGCGSYLIASIQSPGFRQSVQCLYDPGSHALVASDGYDDCGAFCGGVNHVHWGVTLSPCGITPDTVQGSCNADAGPDGG